MVVDTNAALAACDNLLTPNPYEYTPMMAAADALRFIEALVMKNSSIP
jgi:hypothetical protein